LLCGFADIHIPAERLRDLPLALARCRNEDELRACLDDFATLPATGRIAAARDWIGRCYAGGTVEEILDALQSAPEAAARAAGAEVAGNAPTSLKVTLQALRDARPLDLEGCLEREFHTSCSITRQPDFIEGVRAAVVDKDRSPRWAPSRLSDVGAAEVLRHLGAMDGGELGLR
jgi:enoyl-CoA hydratase